MSPEPSFTFRYRICTFEHVCMGISNCMEMGPNSLRALAAAWPSVTFTLMTCSDSPGNFLMFQMAVRSEALYSNV